MGAADHRPVVPRQRGRQRRAGDRLTGTRGDLKREDDRRGPSKAELASITLSAAVTVLLFAYVLVQAVQAPEGPRLSVSVERVERTPDGVEVHVLLQNGGGVGVRFATVEVPCDDPPPSQTFQNLPAHGYRRGVLVCPPDAGNLTAEVSGWVLT